MPQDWFETLADVGSPERFSSVLSHDDMWLLADNFTRWAMTEEKLNDSQRAVLIRLSAKLETVAWQVGPEWQPPRNDGPEELLAFIARAFRNAA